jgi:predicted Zn-dependent protease
MRKPLACCCLLALVLVAACARAPITGRQQLILVPETQVEQMGDRAYQDVLGRSEVVTGTPEAQLVQETGQRIAAAAPSEGYKWKFSLIKDDQANAFALPGGNVVVYSGLLKYAQTPDELAAVIAHEVAHDVARHGAERMSQQLLAQLGGAGLQAAVGAQSPVAMDALMAAYGAGAQIGFLLPFSRTQETEADRIGLILMAKAGYNPRAAVQFWRKMAAAGGRQPPTFLSTHPADEQRIAKLEEFMPEALSYYRPRQQPQPSGQGGWVFGPAR